MPNERIFLDRPCAGQLPLQLPRLRTHHPSTSQSGLPYTYPHPGMLDMSHHIYELRFGENTSE
jgi:hypothetical protein